MARGLGPQEGAGTGHALRNQGLRQNTPPPPPGLDTTPPPPSTRPSRSPCPGWPSTRQTSELTAGKAEAQRSRARAQTPNRIPSPNCKQRDVPPERFPLLPGNPRLFRFSFGCYRPRNPGQEEMSHVRQPGAILPLRLFSQALSRAIGPDS